MDTSPGGARTLFAGGGHIYGFNNITSAPQLVANPGPNRTRITIHNPGPNDIFIAPTVIQNNGNAPVQKPADNTLFVPGPGLLGGCLRIYGNGGSVVIDGDIAQKGWVAFSADPGNNPLTVMTSNV